MYRLTSSTQVSGSMAGEEGTSSGGKRAKGTNSIALKEYILMATW